MFGKTSLALVLLQNLFLFNFPCADGFTLFRAPAQDGLRLWAQIDKLNLQQVTAGSIHTSDNM